MCTELEKNGFSLIELMVTVAIIGILAAMGLADYHKLTIRARYARTKAELFGISEVAQGMRVVDDEVLGLVTGSWCTECFGNPLSSWQALGYTSVPLDPWNKPYNMDENEMEFGETDCRNDMLASGGENQTYFGDETTVDDDDIAVRVPFYLNNANCASTNLLPWQVGPGYVY